MHVTRTTRPLLELEVVRHVHLSWNKVYSLGGTNRQAHLISDSNCVNGGISNSIATARLTPQVIDVKWLPELSYLVGGVGDK